MCAQCVLGPSPPPLEGPGYEAIAGYAHHKSKGVQGHTPPGKFRFSHLLRAILVHSEYKIYDLL